MLTRRTLLHAGIAWDSGSAHWLGLNFGTNGSALFLDGVLEAQGPGTIAVPPNLAQMVIGSALDGGCDCG